MSTIEQESATSESSIKRGIPEGLWIKCPGCSETIYRKEVDRNLSVCPKCDYHMYVSAWDRIGQLLDENTFELCDENVLPTDPLCFTDKKSYAQRLVDEQKRTGLTDAALCGTGMIRARRVAIAITDSAFIMGSMGSVVGERLTRLVERATAHRLPLIIVSGSGGGAKVAHSMFLFATRWSKYSRNRSPSCHRPMLCGPQRPR